jgi:coproporphyrinogen III oxidase
MKSISKKKKIATIWFKSLRDEICNEFLNLEKKTSKKKIRFTKKKWSKSKKKSEGGGEMTLLRNGNIFEKVGVNISEVSGKFDEKYKKQIPGTEKNPNYWAAGISLVAHFKNPKIPSLHFNTRYIVTTKEWFGGGMDVTPCIPDTKQKKYFHNELKKMCDRHNSFYYKKHKKNCDRYFYLPHRKEPRGDGGIFYDYLNTDNWEKDFSYTKDVGMVFLKIAKNIIEKKINLRWNKKEKIKQLHKRARYAEFNLLYDRGTKFGLATGGNIEAIFMSLPPLASW